MRAIDSQSVVAPRRRAAALLAASALAVGPFVVVGAWPANPSPDVCGAGEVLVTLDGPDACTHADQPPGGVDVRQPVSTKALKAREGASETAVAAGETLGVAAPANTDSLLPSVPCDGDGVTGNRVQAMYVVEQGRQNRFAELEENFKLWAAGVDDVVNRSAAVTGGVRNVRYVTAPGASGTCEAKVLNVTVPAGSLETFTATVNALQALGYTRADRKYLMWTDAHVLCGVASLRFDDRDSPDNANNGGYAQYARIDTACWGLGDAAGQHSTEAHELGHMLGGVQNSSPNSTKGGHCTDEQDTLCYADSSSVKTVEVCPAASAYLLDCNGDDYFNTAPKPGSYLDTHWNAADSAFLINGGSIDPTATFGGTVGVNNPAVPGLATQVTVTPRLVDGRTLRSVTWSVDRADCTFSDPTLPQSALVCDASATGTGHVAARLVDSTGDVATVSGELLLAESTRDASLSVALTDASPDPTQVCIGQETSVVARVVDSATGLPIKGVAVAVSRHKEGATSTPLGSAVTNVDGAAVVSDVVTTGATYTARTTESGVYLAGSAEPLSVTAVDCVVPTTTALTGSVDRKVAGFGETIVVTGSLSRITGKEIAPLAGAPVALSLGAATVDTAVTSADGTYSVRLPLERSGELAVRYAGTDELPAASAALGWVDARIWDSIVGLSASKKGKFYVLSGTVLRSSGQEYAPSPNRSVEVHFTPADSSAPQLLGTATTDAQGAYTLNVDARTLGSGTMVTRTTTTVGYKDATSPAVTISTRK